MNYTKYLMIILAMAFSDNASAETVKIICESLDSKSLSPLHVEFDETKGTLKVDDKEFSSVNISSSAIVGYSSKVTLDSKASKILGSDSQVTLMSRVNINRMNGNLEQVIYDVGNGFQPRSSLIFSCQLLKAKF